MFVQHHIAGQKQGYLDADLLSTQFNGPYDACPITSTQIIISDSKNDQLRLLDLANDSTTTIDISPDFLNAPRGISKATINQNEGVLICDTQNSKIKFLNGKTGQLQHFAGSSPGYLDGALHKCRLDQPSSIVQSKIDKTIYISDTKNHLIRCIPHGSGSIYTLCGTPNRPGHTDKTDELSGKSAQFNSPGNIVVLKSGNLLVCDTGNSSIRHIHVGAKLVTTVVGERGVKFQNIKFRHNTEFVLNGLRDEQKYHVFADQIGGKFQITDQRISAPESLCECQDGGILIGCGNGKVYYMNSEMKQIYQVKELVGLGRVTGMSQFDDKIILCDYSCQKIHFLTISDYNKSIKDKSEVNMNLAVSTVKSQYMQPQRIYQDKNKVGSVCSVSGVNTRLQASILNRNNAQSTFNISQPEIYPFSFENMLLLLNIMNENYSGKQIQILSKTKLTKMQQESEDQDMSISIMKGKSNHFQETKQNRMQETIQPETLVNYSLIQQNFELIAFLSVNKSPINDISYDLLKKRFIQEILTFNPFLYQNKLIDSSITGILTALSTASGPNNINVAIKLSDSDNLTQFFFNQQSNTFYSEFFSAIQLDIIASYNTTGKNLMFAIFDLEGNKITESQIQSFPAHSGGLRRIDEEVAISTLKVTSLIHNSSILEETSNTNIDLSESLIQGNFTAFRIQFQVELMQIDEEVCTSISKRMLVEFNLAMSDYVKEEIIECVGINKNLKGRVKISNYE